VFPVLTCLTYDYDEWIKSCLNQRNPKGQNVEDVQVFPFEGFELLFYQYSWNVGNFAWNLHFKGPAMLTGVLEPKLKDWLVT